MLYLKCILRCTLLHVATCNKHVLSFIISHGVEWPQHGNEHQSLLATRNFLEFYIIEVNIKILVKFNWNKIEIRILKKEAYLKPCLEFH